MDKTSKMIHHIKELDLSQKECSRLIEILNDYHEDRLVGVLVKKLISLLQPVEYLPLLTDIRCSISKQHICLFDQMINGYLFAPQKLLKDPRKTQSVILPKDCMYHSLCSSTVRKGNYTFKVVTIEKVFCDVGIFICAKTENASGIKIGNVTHNSVAHRRDIRYGDYIIELNGKPLEKVSLKSTLKILPLLTSLHLIIKRPDRPYFDSQSVLFNPWTNEKIYPSLNSGSYQVLKKKPSNQYISIMLIRKSFFKSIGISIRGGLEYGCQVYISSIVKGSIADEKGLKVGDCILNINGKSFKDILHKQAAQIIQSHSHLNIKVQRVGFIARKIERRNLKAKESVGYLSQSLDNLNTKSQNDLTNKPTTSLKKSSQNRWKSTSDIYTSIKGDGDESFAGDMEVNRFEERWRNLLIVNEYTRLKAILIHYKKNKDVKTLAGNIILEFNPNKILDILNDVRELVRKDQLRAYDDFVSAHFDGMHFKSLDSRRSRSNPMPSSVSKLWFHNNDFDEPNVSRLETLSGKSSKVNSTCIDDFSSESNYDRYRNNNTSNGSNIDRVGTFDSSSSVGWDMGLLSSDYRGQDRRPTHLKTRQQRDNKSKSLKSSNVFQDLHGSSFSRDDNWILQRPEDEEIRLITSSHHSSSRRPHVGAILSTSEKETTRKLDLHSDSPLYENNNNNNTPQVKYNSLHKDQPVVSAQLRHHKTIRVAPQIPSKGKQLNISDESNKYTIQIGSRSMMIEGVTLQKFES